MLSKCALDTVRLLATFLTKTKKNEFKPFRFSKTSKAIEVLSAKIRHEDHSRFAQAQPRLLLWSLMMKVMCTLNDTTHDPYARNFQLGCLFHRQVHRNFDRLPIVLLHGVHSGMGKVGICSCVSISGTDSPTRPNLTLEKKLESMHRKLQVPLHVAQASVCPSGQRQRDITSIVVAGPSCQSPNPDRRVRRKQRGP